MTTKPAFPALGAPMSPVWVHGSPRVEDLAPQVRVRRVHDACGRHRGCREQACVRLPARIDLERANARKYRDYSGERGNYKYAAI
jgi:hypothetical protein